MLEDTGTEIAVAIRRTRPSPGPAWLSVVLAVSLAAAACAPKEDRLAVSGYVRVASVDLLVQRGPESGFPCDSAENPLADVRNGATVVVSDGKGSGVGAGKLGKGSTYVKFKGGRSGGCEWPFAVRVRSAPVYRFTVAGQPPVVVSAADVKANARQLELRFGS